MIALNSIHAAGVLIVAGALNVACKASALSYEPETASQTTAPDQAAAETATAESATTASSGCDMSEFAMGFSQNGSIQYAGYRNPQGRPAKSWDFTVVEGARKGTTAKFAYSKGERDGAVTVAQAGGKTVVKGAYRAGQRSGVWELHYPNGQLMAKGQMKDGVRCGAWEHFTLDGAPIETPAEPPCE